MSAEKSCGNCKWHRDIKNGLGFVVCRWATMHSLPMFVNREQLVEPVRNYDGGDCKCFEKEKAD